MSDIILRDIKFPRVNSLKLLRGNIINRSSISSNYTSDTITIPNVSFPLASRIFKYTDIEVNVKDNWIFVKNNDMGALHDAYLPCSESIAKIDPMEDIILNNRIIIDDKVDKINIVEEIASEEVISGVNESEPAPHKDEAQSEDSNIEVVEKVTSEENKEESDESEDEEKSNDLHDDGDVDYYDYSGSTEDNVDEQSENSEDSDTVVIEQQVSNNQPNRNGTVYNNQYYHNKHKKKH